MKVSLELSKSEWMLVIQALGMAGGLFSKEGYAESCRVTIRVANSIKEQVRLDDFPEEHGPSPAA